MAKTNTFECCVISPEQEVLRCLAFSAVFTAHDGEVGILLNRAPLLTELGIGSVRIDGPDGLYALFVDGGFAQMLDNTLTILTEQAREPSQIDADAAREALADAQALKIADEASFIARDKAIRRAQAQIRLAKGG